MHLTLDQILCSCYSKSVIDCGIHFGNCACPLTDCKMLDKDWNTGYIEVPFTLRSTRLQNISQPEERVVYNFDRLITNEEYYIV